MSGCEWEHLAAGLGFAEKEPFLFPHGPPLRPPQFWDPARGSTFPVIQWKSGEVLSRQGLGPFRAVWTWERQALDLAGE